VYSGSAVPLLLSKYCSSVTLKRTEGKLPIINQAKHPEDIMLRFVSPDWPEKDIIVYIGMPFEGIYVILYKGIRNDIVKASFESL
jgi:hypothetical protein